MNTIAKQIKEQALVATDPDDVDIRFSLLQVPQEDRILPSFERYGSW
jgi:hypothetical protein